MRFPKIKTVDEAFGYVFAALFGAVILLEVAYRYTNEQTWYFCEGVIAMIAMPMGLVAWAIFCAFDWYGEIEEKRESLKIRK